MHGTTPRSYLVECYWPGVSEEKLAAAAERVRAAASELSRHGREVRFVGSILVPADETVFCLFDGLEDDVRTVSEHAGVPFERVLASLLIDGKQPQRRRRQGG
ncbi:MAG TPA: nickel-binding protein [Sporichthya sp.]|nr:nickel-binding protein [Sporichthya sp.]